MGGWMDGRTDGPTSRSPLPPGSRIPKSSELSRLSEVTLLTPCSTQVGKPGLREGQVTWRGQSGKHGALSTLDMGGPGPSRRLSGHPCLLPLCLGSVHTSRSWRLGMRSHPWLQAQLTSAFPPSPAEAQVPGALEDHRELRGQQLHLHRPHPAALQ